MSIIGSNILAGAAGSGVSAYEIEQSLRFKAGSSYIQYPDDSFGNETGTYSFWVKRSELGAENTILWNTRVGGHWGFRFDGANTFTLFKTASGIDSSTTTTAVFRDPSAWYHILVTTTSSANEVFVNGTSVATGSYEWAWIDANPRIGYRSSTDSFQGYLAEWHYISGSVKSVSDFTETDDNGVLRPIEYEGSYGTNGYYLKFDTTDTNGILHDSSGQGNHFDSSTGITTSGTGTDVMSDTPTTNWATLNPLWNPIQATYAEGNLKFTGGSEHSPSASSISASSGKFYLEATALSGSAAKWSFGIIDIDIPYRKQTSAINYIPGYTPNNVYSQGDAISLYDNNIYKNGSVVVSSPFSGGAVAAGDVVQMAVDIDAGKIWFGIDDTWNNGGGTEGAFDSSGHDTTFTADKSYIFHFTAESCGWEVNFGQRDFEYTPPTGFKSLNTSNLPAPDIAKGSDYFNTVLYTGDNTNQAITGVGFQPDWVWIKSRSSISDHVLQDAVRGVQKFLISNNTSSEDTDSGTITSFDSDGFTIGSGNNKVAANNSGETFVAWNWLAGGSTSSNTDGSITSTVSANPTAGFSIVSYGGNSTAGATVGHGLGVAPKAFVLKNRDDSVARWCMYHVATGATGYMRLDGTPKFITDSVFNNTAPSSTTFTLGGGYYSNRTGDDYIAYCFAEVESYSRIDKYTGNGSSDGPFVYCGFRPAWVIIKRTDTDGASWSIRDTTRSPYNVVTNRLWADLNNAESTSTTETIDILSNGFKPRNNVAGINASGGTYLYIALAENPFGGSGVSPATAR